MEQQNQEPSQAGSAPHPPSPSIRFSCPSCGMLLEVAAELAGVRAPCPGCREEITAPLVSEPKPRPLRPRCDRSTAEPEQGINSPPPPVASPGHPPSSPPRAVASPPLPKSPPEGSEAQFEAAPRRGGARASGSAVQARAINQPHHRPLGKVPGSQGDPRNPQGCHRGCDHDRDRPGGGGAYQAKHREVYL